MENRGLATVCFSSRRIKREAIGEERAFVQLSRESRALPIWGKERVSGGKSGAGLLCLSGPVVYTMEFNGR